MGSAYTTLAADAIARYQRLRGRRVTFVTGTDEHGEKIAEAAARKGQAPQEHCDAVVASFKALWDEVTPIVGLCPRASSPLCMPQVACTIMSVPASSYDRHVVKLGTECCACSSLTWLAFLGGADGHPV